MGTHQSKLWKNARCCCVTCFINSLKKKWLFTCLEYYPASTPPPHLFFSFTSYPSSFINSVELSVTLQIGFWPYSHFFFFGVHNATSYNSVIMCSIHNAIPCQNNNYDIFLEISNDFSNKTWKLNHLQRSFSLIVIIGSKPLNLC